MGTEELSLTWDDHHSTLVGVFEKLLESNTLVDCTIAAEGQYLKAHKVVLSACSPYFELLFTHENEKNPIVVLKDVKFQDLKSIIDFVYRGKVRIAEDRLEDFVAAAESLQIKGLGTGQKENALNGKEIELSAPKRGGCASSLSHKRIRKSCASNSEANTHSLSSVIDIPHETNRSKSFPQNEKSATVSISHPPVVSVSQTEISSSGFVQDVRSQEKPICVRAGPSTSYVSQVETSLPLTETQPTLESCETAVKSEPEPIAEVFLPETECFIEPKNEVCVEELEMLDNESETDIVMAGDACQQSQQNANQFSDFSTSHETADMRSNELVQMAGHSSSLGAPSTLAACTDPLSDQSVRPAASHSSLWQSGLLAVAAAADAGLGYPPAPDAEVDFRRRARSHACAHCGKTFSAPCMLQRHMRVHTGERPFVCQHCGRAFTQKHVLREHLRALHQGERGFACRQCPKRFTQKSGLVDHERVHSAERPFACQQCGWAFKLKCNLQKHERVHSGERPFACQHCGRAFLRKSSLRQHQLLHTGERPFPCSQCTFAALNNSALKKHVRTVHEGPLDAFPTR